MGTSGANVWQQRPVEQNQQVSLAMSQKNTQNKTINTSQPAKTDSNCANCKGILALGTVYPKSRPPLPLWAHASPSQLPLEASFQHPPASEDAGDRAGPRGERPLQITWANLN